MDADLIAIRINGATIQIETILFYVNIVGMHEVRVRSVSGPRARLHVYV